VDSAYLKL